MLKDAASRARLGDHLRVADKVPDLEAAAWDTAPNAALPVAIGFLEMLVLNRSLAVLVFPNTRIGEFPRALGWGSCFSR